MAATKKSVKKNGNGNAVAVLDESMFEADAGLGLENVTAEDLALPFLKVLSRQDPILDDLDAKAGDIYNTVTHQSSLFRKRGCARNSLRFPKAVHPVGPSRWRLRCSTGHFWSQ